MFATPVCLTAVRHAERICFCGIGAQTAFLVLHAVGFRVLVY